MSQALHGQLAVTPKSTDQPENVYRPDIQGLRALAILSVVIYHADDRFLPGGFAGVDIFFVISGYLITGILVRDMRTGNYSLPAFYARRIARLFPALIAMLMTTLMTGLLILPPSELQALASSFAPAAAFFSNFHFRAGTDYFGLSADLQPLLHTWSLAIEEQFYIFFPLLLLAIARFPTWVRRAAIWVALVVSFAWATKLMLEGHSGAFFSPFARAYELMIGALLAVGAVPPIKGRLLNSLAMFAGLGLVSGTFFLLDGGVGVPGYKVAFACIGCALLIQAGSYPGLVSQKLLDNPVAKFFGDISYSLYLWHWPTFVFARYLYGGELNSAELVFCIALSIAIAAASYRWIEQPVLARQWSQRTAFTVAIATMLTAGVAASIVHAADGFPQRFSKESHAYLGVKEQFSPYRESCHVRPDQMWTYSERCTIGSGVQSSVAVWGDSFGVELAAALADPAVFPDRAILPLTASACPPARPRANQGRSSCEAFRHEALTGLKEDQSVGTVVLAAHYLEESYDSRTPRALLEVAADLKRAGKRVFIVLPVPHYKMSVPTALAVRQELGWPFGASPLSRAEHLREAGEVRRELFSVAEDIGVELIDPMSALCDAEFCSTTHPTHGVLYFDATHLSVSGASLLVSELNLAALINDIP